MSVLVGHHAPDFTAPAVLPNGEITNDFALSKNIQGKYAAIIFYPLDFTFVCPTELIALNARMSQFKERGVEVIAISIDSQFTHNAWRNTPIEQGGIGPVHYPLIADISHHICKAYGVEHPVAGVAMRAAFIIDRQGIVRSQIVNDLPLGRNIDEIIRLVDALRHFDEHGEVCPAGWHKGQSGMEASSSGVASYLAEHHQDL